jgi:transcriptional regulator with XRE-family HTH domain
VKLKAPKAFVQYLRQLREDSGLTLREVEERTHISNSYLSRLERGLRKVPHPDILRKLAEAYSVAPMELMRAAGFLTDTDNSASEKAKFDMAFRHVMSDPNYDCGMRVTGPVSDEMKRFIIREYEKKTKRKILDKNGD